MGKKLKIGCIGARSSGVGQMLLLERYEPGSCVAFCDLNRKLFDEIVGDIFPIISRRRQNDVYHILKVKV